MKKIESNEKHNKIQKLRPRRNFCPAGMPRRFPIESAAFGRWETELKKIGIYVCGNVSKKCTANGCLRAFNDRQDSFSIYEGEETRLVSFNNCSGCDEDPLESLIAKIEKFKKAEVEAIHLSTCIRGKCKLYKDFVEELSKHFDVIGYTHGSATGKLNNNYDKSKVLL